MICLIRVFGLSGPRPPVLISGPRPLKNFKLTQSPPVTMIIVYGFMGYLNHIDLLMSHVHVLKKHPYCYTVHLSFFVNFILCLTEKYMFKVNKLVLTVVALSTAKMTIQKKGYIFRDLSLVH